MSDSSDSTKNVIIFGSTGAIGTELAQILSREHPDWNMFAATRDPSKPSRLESLHLPNVTMVQGDPFDADSVTKLCQDCTLIFSCIGFEQYEAKYWAGHWPTVTRHLLQQVTSTTTTAPNQQQQRRLVFCDNLYAYGAGHDSPITTKTPAVEASLQEKGKPGVRSWMRQEFQRHMERHPGTLAVVGGSDFFGPHVTRTSVLGDTITGKLVQGQTALAIGSVSPVHDFCFAPDFARALATVAIHEYAWDRFWICPHTIHDKSLQTIANDIAAKIDSRSRMDDKKKDVSFSVLTKPLLYLLSPFMSFAKEMIEMYTFWTKDYRVDDSEFCQTFNVQATGYDEALQALVDFYKVKVSIGKAT